ncbi:hypothetical protein U3516DRAFT_761627 [Neocallimastix sp. 'constans']
MQYNIDIFVDGIFKFSPKCGYQVFITRTYVNELNKFNELQNFERSKTYVVQLASLPIIKINIQVFMTNICSKLCGDNLIFLEGYINKCQNEEPLRNTAHGNKREN